jgi:hypothetical protein
MALVVLAVRQQVELMLTPQEVLEHQVLVEVLVG